MEHMCHLIHVQDVLVAGQLIWLLLRKVGLHTHTQTYTSLDRIHYLLHCLVNAPLDLLRTAAECEEKEGGEGRGSETSVNTLHN